MNYIGIDLGTSALKLLLMNEQGRIINTISKEYPVSYPHPGWSEQNPEDWWTAVSTGIPQLLSGFDPSSVKAIGTAGQMHGLVTLDDQDAVLRPAILWNDSRSQPETDYLNEVIGRDKLNQYTANIAYAGFTAPKILWMKQNEPDLFKQIKKIMLPKDYINYRLTGAFSTDYSDASGTLLLDVKHKRWSKDMLKICDVREAQLPQLYESDAAVGTLKPDIAEQLGLSPETIVCAGAGDNAAAAVGCGAVHDGQCNLSIGTSGTIFIATDQLKNDEQNSLHAFAHANRHYHLMGCILSAASCNQWWMNSILNSDDYEAEQQKINEEHLGRNNVYYLPYLMGERSPLNDSYAESCFIGMSMSTAREDMTQAVFEGVAFAIRDCLEAAKKQGVVITSTTVCGGGMKSTLWRRIFANVLNIDLKLPATVQGPGYGAAMLAAVAAGEWNSVEQAADQIVTMKETDQPEPELAALYEKRYQMWHQLYPSLKESFRAMGDLR